MSEEVRFMPRRHWHSPQTGAAYPVEADFEIRLPEGTRSIRLTPLFDAQELDGRATGMPSYWEGLVSPHPADAATWNSRDMPDRSALKLHRAARDQARCGNRPPGLPRRPALNG
jgi:hypothetical protein